MNILLGRTSPRCNIKEVEEQKLPCDVLRPKHYQEYTAFQIIRKFFIQHIEYSHLVLASDDIVVKPKDITQLAIDLIMKNDPVICGMMNVDEKDYPNGRLAIAYELPDKMWGDYKWLKRSDLHKNIDIFPVEFNGFCLMSIRRDIIERYEFKADTVLRGGTDPAFGGSYDLVFCWWCKENGIPIYVDKRIDMVHLRQSGKLDVNSNPETILIKNGIEIKL